MKFRTEIDLKPLVDKIDYQSQIFAIGSCFAASIGGALAESKFNISVNPSGVMFNPLSIAASIERYAECRLVSESELQCSAGRCFHYDFHSSLSASSPEEAVYQMNNAVVMAHQELTDADWVIITLGTSWVYSLVDSGAVVANCHKQPARLFERKRVGVAQIVERLSALISNHLYNKKVILTLSPVRHIADGLAENSLSKATLRLAIDELVSRFDNAFYFPSYEILIDDLRDYRFYADDMVHPSTQAVEYIFEHFCRCAISESAQQLMGRVEQIKRAVQHRPYDANSEAYMSFCRRNLELIEQLPMIDFSDEALYFESFLEKNS